MKLGFISNAFAHRPIAETARWGRDRGYDFVEVGPHAPLDELRDYLVGEPVLPVHALLYCRNIRHPDPAQRQAFRQATEARLDLARDHNIGIVSISTGIDPARSLRANVADSAGALQELCDYAGPDVMVAVENCPDTGNIAVNPDLWAALIGAVDRPNFKLTYDPSHLVRLGLEPYALIEEFAPHIVHVHAKDAEVLGPKLARRGFLDEGWWRYRVPGWGQVDWRRVLTHLGEIGFRGGISLEHEDPLFGGDAKGEVDSEYEAERGLHAGKSHLVPLLEILGRQDPRG